MLGQLGIALRATFRRGYKAADLRADVLAGIVVGIVALPLSMALAIASGATPQNGLYTAIFAGAIIAILGGASHNVSGPTASFVLLAPVSAHFGLGGLLCASVMAGLILLSAGMLRLGRLIQYIPHPVTTGFTTGIAVVIATLQVKDFLGLSMGRWPEHYHDKVAALARALPSARWQDVAIGVFTLLVLLAWPRITKRVPGPLVAITLGALLAHALASAIPGFSVATIGSKFSYVKDGITLAGIPRELPGIDWPWNQPGANGEPIGLSFAMVKALMGPAFAIAALGAIESLLCAVVVDGMAGTKHDSNVELAAQGIGNMLTPFFGGIAATGALARSATNIRAGSRSPMSAIFHSIFVLAVVLALAPLLANVPMASLAALLVIVAWNMSELRHFTHVLRVAPRSDVTVLLTCFGLTVVFDLVVAVTVGILLAALLFMHRMSTIFETKLSSNDHPRLRAAGLEGVVVYEIAGPMFFGAAEKAISRLGVVAGNARAVILQMNAVPVMDVTGLVALESALNKLAQARTLVVLAGVQEQPREILAKANIVDRPGVLRICDDGDQAIATLRAELEQRATPKV